MPGSVPVAAPAESFPAILYASFAEIREWRVDANEYRGGEFQAAVLGSTSRKAWKLSARLSADALGTLRTFWESVGKTTPFYFDHGGVTYAVVFSSGWQQTAGMARGDVSLELIEVS